MNNDKDCRVGRLTMLHAYLSRTNYIRELLLDFGVVLLVEATSAAEEESEQEKTCRGEDNLVLKKKRSASKKPSLLLFSPIFPRGAGQ